MAGTTACRILDALLSKGCPEAIVEGFYSTMRSQYKFGGQSLDTLRTRSRLKWIMPPLGVSDSILQDAFKAYIEGGNGLKRHRYPVLSSFH